MNDHDVLTTLSLSERYGALQAGFHFDLRAGYSVLVGRNNAGKSAILQLAFRTLMGIGDFSGDRICFISPDRQHLAATQETAGGVLSGFNNGLNGELGSRPIAYESAVGERPFLARLLLSHTDMVAQLTRANEIFERLGLPSVQVRAGQRIHFGDVEAILQGSGLRALYPVVAALTDPQLRVILIDEPELSLEPVLQKALRDLLLDHATDGRAIVVSTHSHLFLNRRDIGLNFVVRKEEGEVVAEPVRDQQELFDLVFRLLGNSTEDLFFPSNYVVVEGASDQVVLERAIDLLGPDPRTVKVLSATGVTELRSTLHAIERALLPLIVADSPYATRVVAVVDRPNEENQERVGELRRHLGNRLIDLPAPSLEESVPEAIFAAAELDKADCLKRISDETSLVERRAIKRDISTKLAAVVTVDLLDEMPEIKEAAILALEP